MSSTVENHPHKEGKLGDRFADGKWSRSISRKQLEALLSAGAFSRERRAQLQATPGFAAAVRTTARGLAQHHRGNRLLNAIISDRGRFLATLFVLDLHFRREEDGVGLTPGRLKELCVEQNVCSATRAGALLALMKLGGFVEAAPRGPDGRLRELIPTPKLIAQQSARWRCYLIGSEALLANAARAQALLDDPEFVSRAVRLMSAHFRAGFRFVDHAPNMRLFTDRNGGMFVLLSLLATDRVSSDELIQISISELARCTSTSRAHVIKMLRDAEADGLLHRGNGGGIRILPPLERDVGEFFALCYLWVTYMADVIVGQRPT